MLLGNGELPDIEPTCFRLAPAVRKRLPKLSLGWLGKVPMVGFVGGRSQLVRKLRQEHPSRYARPNELI